MAHRKDLLTTLGREFAAALADASDEVSGQDAYEVFSDVLGPDFGLQALRELSAAQVEALRLATERHLELDHVGAEMIKETVSRTVWHWSEGD